jgi:hypothetical protein
MFKNLIERLPSVAAAAFLVLMISVTAFGQTLYDSFSDGEFISNPAWTGTTSSWGVVANSDVAAGATGSNTLRLNAPAFTGTEYLSSQIAVWGTSQEWGVFWGRRFQAHTAANQQYFWLYANEANLNSATVDGYRLAIGDDSGADEIRLEYIVNGAVNATVISSTGTIPNSLTDIGFLVRVTRSATGDWQLFTSALPTVNGTGAIATDIPNAANASVSQGTGTNNALVPAANGFIGVAALHSTGANAISAAEFDQIYFTPTVPPAVTINVNDGVLAEPASGTRDLVFTITLSQAAATNVSVNFQTADGTAVSGSCGTAADYTTTSGSATFLPGERLKTVNVPVCADTVGGEGVESFFLNLSNPVGAVLGDSQGVGTITQVNPPGALIISEIRTSGPGGAGDDFVELYNNSDSPLTVTASDASAGYGIYKMGADCNADPVLIGIIPNATIIPARGHFLLVGSAYTLANYGGTGAAAGNLTMSSDIENDRNVAVFTTSDIASLSTVNRLDAVGFGLNTGQTCNLLREGSTLPALFGSTLDYTFFRDQCAFVFPGCPLNGVKRDANNNAADFIFAETTGTPVGGVGERLGAPGPENISSPRSVNGGVQLSLLDSTVSPNAPPNQVRDFTSDPANNSTFGTYSFRRRFTNNTGSTITRLRFRIIDITTDEGLSSPFADLRARTSGAIVINGINDVATCASTGSPPSVPCQVTAQAATLEQPPAQPAGGGFNSTLTATLPSGLPAGQSLNFNFLFGIQANPTAPFRVCFVVESLPTGGSTTHCISDGFATAANAEISGRLVTANGAGISNATVMLTGGDLTQPVYVRTGSFGYYRFTDLTVGQIYVVTVSSKRFTFANPTRVVNLFDSVTDENFTAEAQ